VRCPVPCFECGSFTMELDMSLDHQHIACQQCERIWCAQCVGRFELRISDEWLKRQRVAALN